MNKNRLSSIRMMLLALLATSLLASCTQDEITDKGTALPEEKYPLELSAASLGSVATPAKASTRGTVDGAWNGDETVYVQIASSKDYASVTAVNWASIEPIQYTVSTDGSMTLKDPMKQCYWQEADETFYIRAWCPGTGEAYTRIPMPGNDNTWNTTTNQSTPKALEQADFLFAYRSLSFEQRTQAALEFSHLTSKITINLIDSEYLRAQSEENVTVALVSPNYNQWYFSGSFTSTAINLGLYETIGVTAQQTQQIIPYRLPQPNSGAYATYQAVVIPQSIFNMGKNILINVDKATYNWEIQLPNLLNMMESGKEYTFNITVKAKGLQVTVKEDIGWGTNGATGNGNVTLP